MLISELTDFSWDKLYVFDPYESRDVIQNIVGSQFLKTDALPMGVLEENALLVLVKDGKVVHYFNHPRRKGDFAGLEKFNWFTPQTAEFQVIHEGYGLYGKWLKLQIRKELQH